MAEISREEFSKIYKEKIEPSLSELETERLEVQRKSQPLNSFGLICAISMIVLFCVLPEDLKGFGFVLMIPAMVCFCIAARYTSKFRDKLKKNVISKVLSMYGNMYFAGQKDLVKLSEIKNMGLFRQSSSKCDDDIVIGIHKNCNFVITETKLTHQEGSGKTRRTVTDFDGIILKVQMNKKFQGKTVAGMKGDISKPARNFEKVILESVDFMKNREVYSTDQIEARYIFTTSFVEKFQDLGRVFQIERYGGSVPKVNTENKLLGGVISSALEMNSGINSAFIDGYAYIFVPTFEDFFEVSIERTLFDENAYYKICAELDSIMGIIEYLHLDQNTGL